MITKEEYEEAQQIVWDYEEQLKNNSVLDGVMKCYKLKWVHHGCHPETCNHMYDWKVIDIETDSVVEKGDDRRELERKYNIS